MTNNPIYAIAVFNDNIRGYAKFSEDLDTRINTQINCSKVRVLKICIKSPSIEYSMLDGGITY